MENVNYLSILGLIALNVFLFRMLRNVYRTVKFTINTDKQVKAKMKAKEDMLERGEKHDWIKIPLGTKEYLFCRKTGWSPDLNGFLDMNFIKKHDRKIKEEEGYQAFRNERVKRMAEERGVSLDDMEEIVEQVFSIKKDFAILRIEKKQKEKS